MTSRRIDYGLALIGALLILLSSYQLFFSRKGSYEGATLGHVSALEKVVKIKRARALDWVDAFTDDLVTENQMIYTDDLSRVEVKFTEGERLVINENSLVKIRSRGNENELDIGRGTVRATLAGEKSFIFKLNGKDYTLRGKDADVEINLHDQSGAIGVLSGKVEVEQEGKTTALDEKTALVVEGEKSSTKTLAYTITSPARGALLYTGGELSAVSLSWTGEPQGNIFLSTSPDLTDARIIAIENNPQTIRLPQGRYFWKIESESGDSLVSDFRILQETPPEILRPRHGETIDLLVDATGAKNVRLEWEADAAEFSLELNGTVRTLSQKSAVVDVEGNELNWRVKIQSPDRPEAVWSEMQKIKLNVHPFPNVPTNLHPDEVEYQSFSGKPDPVEFSWASEFPGELEIQQNGKTENFKVEGNSHQYHPAVYGKYQWRIRGRDEFSRVSAWSEWKEFTVVDLSGEKVAEGIQRIQLARPDQEVTFGWDGEGTNVFELSKDRSFNEVIISREVRGSQTKLSVPRTGTYYWRSREYKKDGTLHVSEPKKVIIEPVPAPTKPEALPPMEVPLEFTEPTTSFLDLFFSKAYADDVFGIARITLPEREHVKQYILRIYRRGEDRPVVEEKLSDRNFVWKEALPGEYDFQYAVVDFFDRQSPFSDRSLLLVRLTEGPSRPLLISPIRLEKVTSSSVEFRWRSSERAQKYHFALYRDEELKEKIFEEDLKLTSVSLKNKITDGTYYWQTTAIDERGMKTPSRIGRFIYESGKVETIAVPDIAPDWWKNPRNRAHLAWAPSSDSYEFKDANRSGKIEGTATMGLEARATFFQSKWIYSGELLRQQGKVFKKENYSYTRLSMDAGWIVHSGQNSFTIGPVLGFAMGQTYEVSGDKVSASGESGAVYGGALRSFHALDPLWAVEGKLSYLTGTLTEMELSANLMRSMKQFYLLIGAGMVNRTYSKSDGEQTSLKMNAGIGREF